VAGLIPSVYNVELPSAIRSILEAAAIISSIDLNFGTPLSCMGFNGFAPTLVTYMILPVAVLLLIWLVALVLAVRGTQRDGSIGTISATSLVSRATLNALPSILLGLWFLFPSVTSVAFKAFECEEFNKWDGSKVSYLRADYDIECYTSEHTATFTLGILALILYPVGVPLFFFLLLRSARTAIMTGQPSGRSRAIAMLYRYYEQD